MINEEFIAKYERITKAMNALRQERRNLCRVMAEEHPINRLKGKLVSVHGGEPMYFDHLEISSQYDYVRMADVCGYAVKNDGSMSRSMRKSFANIGRIEEEILEITK